MVMMRVVQVSHPGGPFEIVERPTVSVREPACGR